MVFTLERDPCVSTGGSRSASRFKVRVIDRRVVIQSSQLKRIRENFIQERASSYIVLSLYYSRSSYGLPLEMEGQGLI
jgi:hypothetical protein